MGLDRVGLVVKDMQHSLDFYRAMGFSIPESANKASYVKITQVSLFYPLAQ